MSARDGTRHVREVHGHVGTDLVGGRGDARTEERVDGVAMLEVLQRALEDVVLEAPPPGVHDGERRRILVHEEDRHAVRHQHGDGETVAEVDDDVCGTLARWRRSPSTTSRPCT